MIGRAAAAAPREKTMPRPARASIGATGRISVSVVVTLSPHASVNHMTSAMCGARARRAVPAEHQVCGRFGPSSTRSPSS